MGILAYWVGWGKYMLTAFGEQPQVRRSDVGGRREKEKSRSDVSERDQLNQIIT